MPDGRRSPLYAAAGFLLLLGVAYRLMFSSVVGGFFNGGLADIIFFAAMAAYLAAMVRTGAPPFEINLASGAFLLFTLSMAISARTSAYPRAGAEELTDLAALACLFVAASGGLFADRDAPRAAAYLAGLAAVAVAAGFYQYFYGLPKMLEHFNGSAGPLWLDGIYIDSRNLADFRTRIESREVFSLFYTSNVFAGYLALAMPVTLGLAAAVIAGTAPRRTKRLAAISAGALVIAEAVLVILTKSKAGLAAAAFSVILFAALAAYRLLPRKAFVAVLLGALILGGAGGVAGLSRAKQFYYEARTSFEVRLGYWRATWRLISADPYEGVGPGNFAESYLSFKDITEREVRNPHNAYLLVWAEGGFFALLFFVSFWVLVFAAGRATEAKSKSPPAWTAAAAVAAALVLYLVVQGDFTGEDDYQTAAVAGGAVAAAALVFFLWKASETADAGYARAGLAAGAAGFILHSAADVSFTDVGAAAAVMFAAAAIAGRRKAAVLTAGGRPAMFFAALACAGLILFVGKAYVPYSQGEAAMEEARNLMAGGNGQAAADRAREALALDPSNASVPAFLGAVYEPGARAEGAKSKQFVISQEFYRKAIALDHACRNAHEGLARLYESQGPESYDKAIAQYVLLLSAYETNSRYHIDAAKLLEKAGEAGAALSHYKRALEIDDHVEQHGIQLTREERGQVEGAIKRLEAAGVSAGRPRPPESESSSSP
jgi:O-antigen ligase/Tfp pilus assembly protein PilF